MTIRGDHLIRLTNECEKLLVEVGGANPNKSFTKSELSDALVAAIERIDAHSPEYIERLYEFIAKHLPAEELARLEALAEEEMKKGR